MATFTDAVTAPSFSGNITGTLTGPVIGNVSGNVTGNVTGNLTGLVNGGIIPALTNLAGDGAITIPNASAMFYITKATAAALTIAAPTAGTDDGKELTIWSETAAAHVITSGTVGFGGKGASGTLTFGAAKGNSCKFVARNGQWWVTALNGVTIA